MPRKKTKLIKEKEFLFQKDSKLLLIKEEVLNTISVQEAFHLALSTHKAQREQLLLDATNKKDYVVENIKVVDGLEQGLNKLNEIFPNLRKRVLTADQHYYTNIPRC